MVQLLCFSLTIILCTIFNICAVERKQDFTELNSPYVHTFLNYVNEQPDKSHFFSFQKLLSEQEDNGIVKIVLDVKKECTQDDSSVPCMPAIFTCQGTLQMVNGYIQTRSAIICEPKDKSSEQAIPNVLASSTTVTTASTIASTADSVQKVAIEKDRILSKRPGEEYLLKIQHKVPCVGCPIDLSTSAPGIDTLIYTALHHIQSERIRRYGATRVHRIQQQIVAGVKYFMLLEIVPTICVKGVIELAFCPPDSKLNSELCEVTFFQRPWISKKKNIIANNCTLTQEFSALEDSPEYNHNNEVNELHIINSVTTEKIKMGSGKYTSERTVDLADLESQIIVEPVQEYRVPVARDVSFVGQIPGEEVQIRPLNTGQNTFHGSSSSTTGHTFSTLDEDGFYQGDQPQDDCNSSDDSHTKHDHEKDHSSDSSDTSNDARKCRIKSTHRHKKDTSDSSDFDGKNDCKKKPNCKESKKSSSESDNCRDSHHKNNQNIDSESSADCKKKSKKCKKESLDSDSGDSYDCDHNHSQKIRKQNCDNSDSSSSSSDSSSSEDCDKKSKRKKRSSGYLTKLNNDDKILINNLANIALASLYEADKEYQNQLVSDILDVKKELLNNGINYKLNLKVSTCHITTFKCTEKLCKVHVLVNEDITSPKILKSKCKNDINVDEFGKINDIVRNKRGTRKSPRLGGIESIAVDDGAIEDFTEHAMQYYDTQSGGEYKSKVIKIHEASRQLVSGYLYRIKAEIVLSNCLKNSAVDRSSCNQLQGSKSYICNIKVWDQPWHANGRQTNITCHTGTSPQKYSFRSKRESNIHLSYKLVDTDNDQIITLGTFKQFMKVYEKVYTDKDEFKKRYRIFRQNMKKIRLLNKYEEGTAKYGATEFADLTEAEFKKFLGLKPGLRNENNIILSQAHIPDVEIPTEFDWRSKNVVTEVKNQGACGSCWAFSATGNIEGQYALKYGNLLEFSEQELVDCDSTDEGCSGGLMENAYRAIEKLGGLETEQDYPYEAENEKCHFNKSLVKVKVKGALNISQDEAEMAKWLVKNGPISIAINANAMQFYFGGVSHPWKMLCNPKSLDHGVLIVGYGIHKYPYFNKTLPYWIVKNSWGKSWGQQGYYLVYRGDGTCGVNQEPTSAIIE